MALDSDVNNADALLHVEFYESKRDESKGSQFIRIMIPGDKNTIIDRPVQEWDKRRFSQRWLAYQLKNGESNVIGIPLLEWHTAKPEDFTEGQMQEYQALGFRTVEQIATASDGQLQKIGMGGVGTRERARIFLANRNAAASTGEMDELKRQIAELSALLNKPSTDAPQGSPPEVKRGPGRPRKDVNADYDAPVGAAMHE